MVASVKIFLALLALMLCAPAAREARAAIAVSASASGDTDTEVNSLTYGLTIPSGCTNCALFVCSANRAGSITTDTVTYNAASLTEIAEICNDSQCLSLWYKIAPTADAASHDVVLNYSDTTYHASVAVALSGVHQTTAVGTHQSNDSAGFGSSTSTTVSSAGDELVIDCAQHSDSSLTLTADAGQTEEKREESDHATTANNIRVALSSKPGAGSVTMTWNVDGGSTIVKSIGVPVKPAAIAANNNQGETPLFFQ